MTRTSLLAVIVLSGILNSALAKDCEAEVNWSAARACVEEQQKEHLNAVFQDALEYIGRDNPKAAELLVKSQKDWLIFAESSCEFTVESRLPDSNDLRLGCWQTFVKARERVLAAYKRDHGKVPTNLMNP